jgi:bifunctional lysine-specific demethylase and histidyl-hydroxylase NO66
MALDRLVSDPGALQEAWEVQPLLSRGLGSGEDLLSLESVARLIDQHGLRLPYFRMLKDGRPLPTSAYSRRLGRDRGQLTGVIDPDAVRAHLAEGVTLVLQGLRFYHPEISALCDGLSAEIGHPVHANAYLTPAASNGAGRHYDDHSVFMRQVAGRKRWRIQAPIEQWPTSSCSDSRIDTEVVMDVELGPGDCLYVPRGFVHDGSTGAEPSLHLSFTLDDPPTWGEILLDALAAEVATRTPLRAILPMAYAADPDRLEAQASLMIEEARRALDAIEAAVLVDGLVTSAERTIAESRHGAPGRPLAEVLGAQPDPATDRHRSRAIA